MKTILFLLPVVALVGCTPSQQYAGLNYARVQTETEDWEIAGGKDETNVTFTVTRPDGTTATYHADNADASTVIKAMTDQYSAVMGQMLTLIQALVPPAPAP